MASWYPAMATQGVVMSPVKEVRMPKTPIIPAGSAPPLAPYSPGVRAGNTVYVSGMLAIGPGGETVGVGDVAAQTRHVLLAIQAVIEAAGGTMADIAMNSIFLKDLGDYAAVNAVYAEFFPSEPPGPLLHPRRPGAARLPGGDRIRGPSRMSHAAEPTKLRGN